MLNNLLDGLGEVKFSKKREKTLSFLLLCWLACLLLLLRGCNLFLCIIVFLLASNLECAVSVIQLSVECVDFLLALEPLRASGKSSFVGHVCLGLLLQLQRLFHGLLRFPRELL